VQKQSYVGLDVSLAETSICVIDETGARLFEGKVLTDSAAITATVRRHVVGQVVRVGLETGTTAGWLWRELIALGLPAVCLDTRHAHRALSLRVQKTDKNDARGLAELVRLGWYREAKVRSVDAQFVRSLLMARRQLLAIKRNLANQLRNVLKTFGLTRTSTAGRGWLAKVRAIVADTGWVAPVVEPMLKICAELDIQLAALNKQLLILAREDPDVRRMMTVPGIGALTGLAYKAAIDDPSRFTSSSSAGPYLGLVPKVRQSGETEWTGRISKTGDELARTYLYEAAGVLLFKVSRWSALRAWGIRLVQRIGLKRAKIAVARKLAVLLHALWTDGTEFEWRAATT